MFLEEARLSARLNHPNIVQTNEVGSEGDRHFLTMEYLEGQPLHRVTRAAKLEADFPLSMRLHVLLEALGALEYAHGLKTFDGQPLEVVHRDISPQNVFLTFDGAVKLLDFGVAKAADSELETRTGVLKGKIGYMSPEQLTGEKCDARADLFSIGVMLWEAVAHRRMWPKTGDVEIIGRLMRGDLPSLAEAAPNAPKELIQIVAKALAPREERYASAEAFRADLLAYVEYASSEVRPRDLGAAVLGLFADERAKTGASIQEALRKAQTESTTGELPVLEQGAVQRSSIHTPASISRVSRAATSEVSVSQSGMSPATGETPIAVLPPKRNYALYAAAMLAIGFAVWLARRPPQAAASAATVVAAPMAASQTAAGVATASVNTATNEASVTLTISATPASAVVSVDGVAILGAPRQVRVRRGAQVRVDVSAAGYTSMQRTLTPVADATLELALSQEAAPTKEWKGSWTPPKATATATSPSAPGSPPATATTPPPPPPAGPAPTAEPTGKPRRQIDPNNPYG
jgi:serine/threonine-protein kinase